MIEPVSDGLEIQVLALIKQHTVISDLRRSSHFSLSLSLFGPAAHKSAGASSFMRFLDHTQPRTTVGRTPLDE